MCDSNHKIIINNFDNSTTVCYSLVLLKGEIFSNSNTFNNIINFRVNNNNNVTSSTCFLNNNKFKHLLELYFGLNQIKIQYCCSSVILTLNFKPKITDYCVIPLYIICKNHNGRFQCPPTDDNSINSASKRIAIGAKLIQCLLAEKFYENNLTRKTFQLESDINPKAPICQVFHSEIDVKSARKMTQDDLWYCFSRELMQSEYANEKYKYLAFVSCTQYRGDKYNRHVTTHDDIVRITEAHVALGGGGLAIFGSACLHTWPTCVKSITDCFENKTLIDKNQLMDDSCYRGTYGGCFATTLGAVCHELCHTFDLGHTDEGIMGRGFDEINKEFITIPSKPKFKAQNCSFSKKEHSNILRTSNINVAITQNVLPVAKKLNPHPIGINSSQIKQLNKTGVFWTQNCTIFLYYHKWLNEINETEFFLNYENNTISSSVGVCVVEIRNEISGLVLDWWSFNDKPKFTFEIKRDNLSLHFRDQPIVLVVEDIVGNILKHKLE